MRPKLLPSLVAVLLTAAPAVAKAAEPGPPASYRLAYNRSPRASKCPDEEWFRYAVFAHRGYDPFTAEASRVITIRLDRARGVYTSEYTIEPETKAQAHKHTDVDCRNLLYTVALSVHIFIDDYDFKHPTRAKAAPEPVVEPPSPPPPPKPTGPEESAVVTPKRNAHVYLGIDTLLNPVVLPSAGLGGGLAMAARWLEPALSVELAVRGIGSPLPATEPGTPVHSTYVSGVLAACAHLGFVFGCPVIEVGVLKSYGTSGATVETINPTVGGLGGRVGAEWPVTGKVTLRGFGELEAVLTQPQLRVNGQQVWTTPPVSLVFGLGVAVHL